jgi:gliding motility-associated-like protein
MKKFLPLVFAFLSYQCWSQGNMIAINSTVPSQMTICGVPKSFTISIFNPSPFVLTNDTLKLTMPSGIDYQMGSITGATELNTSNLSQPTFLLPNISNLTTLNITYIAVANCGVMAYLAAGGIIENVVRVNYFANNTKNFDTHTTYSYIVRQPNLSISAVTNQSYTGNIGDVFARCVTVTNGGLGELSQFTLTDIHGSGIQITALNKGIWTNSGLTESIVLSGTDFLTIGDGDNLFENGESITICETVNVLNCISVASAFEAYWGCNAQHCQSSVSNANVVFPNLIPNLVITPIATMNSCIGPGNASLQQLKIVNTGLGKAVNVLMDVFQSNNIGFVANLGSNIDPASFTIQIGYSGAPSSVTPTSTVATATLSCMTSPKGRVLFTIPFINAGDTVYVKWNSYSCCYNSCAGGSGDYDINGWRFKGTYENICQSTYVIPETWGRVYSRLRGGLTNNGSPATLTSGQTGTFNFLFSTYEHSYPVGPGAFWKFEFTIPPCLSYVAGAGNLQILRNNGINTWTPTSVTTAGNVVTAIFNGNAPWSLVQAEVIIKLTVDCASCGGTGSTGAVGIKSFYIPNNTCTCAIGVACQSVAVNIICPGVCPEGMIFRNYYMKRTSYGLPDNEAGGGNGLPDPIGSLDFTKIKTDRAMFGDTITASFNGKVKTSLTYPSWQYCYATSSMANGNRLDFVDATLKIYRGGTVIATCTNFATPGNPVVTTSGTTRTFKYNLSVLSLGSCLPGGFVYSNNDSVEFKPRYKVTSNVGNATPLNCYSTNEFYMSDIANPTLPANKFQCSTFNGNCTIIGYYFTNYGPDSYNVKSCDDIIITQNYYLSIGPCCNNYNGGNLFPYEYRNWSHIDILSAIMPAGYNYISARFNQIRTAGTTLSNTSPWVSLTPLNPNSDTLTFPVEQYFQGFGGVTPLSDDGYYGTLQVTMRPSCKVTPTLSQGIRHNWTFATTPQNYLTGSGSATTFLPLLQDYVVYQAPSLFVQATLPSINAPNTEAYWDISISNTSNTSNSLNTWLSGPTISGVTITQVFDLDNNVEVLPVASIYQVGVVNAVTVRHFRVTAVFTSCLKDSIIFYTGWNCNGGYPVSLQTYPCVAKSIKLTLTPLMPSLNVVVTAPASTVQLCDTAIYVATGVNVQLGTAYNTILTAVLPIGVAIVPGSAQMSYPVSGPFVGITDPVFMGGTTWKWDISLVDSIINANGLKGILEPTLNSFKLQFKVLTTCGYTSGSIIAFSLKGQAACGQETGQEVALSSQLGITGANTPYLTAIKLKTTYISPCANNSTMYVRVKNLGPAAFSIADSVLVQLPLGVSFVSGSFAGIHNPPVNSVPTQFTINGAVFLIWKLPSGVTAGDSTVFSFDYKGNALALSCEITQFESQTTSSTNVNCTLSGLNCGINITTGDTTLSVFIYKAYLSLSNGHSTSLPNPPSGETVTVNLDITNTGQAILSGANSILQFYYDTNGNGVYNSGDLFLTQDTLLVTNNATVPYSKTFNVSAGNACSIIAIIRTDVNPCVCNPSQLLLTPRFIVLGNDTTLCSGQMMTLSSPPVTGYTYAWSPTTNLNNPAIANPVLTSSNTTALPVSTDYILTTNRMGCISKDTIQITVNPIPVSNAGLDITTCPVSTLGSLGTSSVSGNTYNWLPVTGLSSITVSNPSVTLSNPDTITYTVTTTALGCSSTDSAVVRVNPLPTATLIGSRGVCLDATAPAITFTGADGTAPYTFTYSFNGGANQIISTSGGDTVTIVVPTSIAGSFVYTLVSVLDASSTACSQLQTGTATITVNPLPTATINGSTETCQGAGSPNITFKGFGGIAPYTFTYTINGGANQIITSIGDSVLLPVSTTTVGTFVYSMIKVQYGSLTSCSQIETGTATVIINPSSTATITGTTEVCEGGTPPVITFVGANGVAPYTFTYAINGVTLPPVTSIGNSAQVAVPTSVAGTFTYSLVSVIDASSTICSQAQTGSAIVTVNPLPTATITGDTGVCKNSAEPTITLTGANGIAPYTFTYKVNNGTNQTISTSNGNSVTLSVPTGIVGTFTYDLISVMESGLTTCFQTQTGSIVVIINPLPQANFGFTDVCLNQTLVFNDSSTVSSGTVTNWLWDFGDNSPLGTTQNPGYLYANPGTYNASLITTTNNGCTDTITKNVVVHPLPSPLFYSASVCDGSSNYFTDQSTIPTTDTLQSWKWNFGDNSPVSTDQFASHLYTGPGSFFVQLVVVSNFGCFDSITKTAVVNPNPDVNFAANDTVGCELLCVYFMDASSVLTGTNVQWLWNVGDGSQPGVYPNFEHCYANDSVFTPATFDITLTVTSDSGCVSTLSKNNYITVYPNPEANFSAMPDTVAIIDPIITILDASTGADFWNWDFGDLQTGTLYNPPPHTYADTGTYTITLVTITQYGCVDTTSRTIYVEPDFVFYIPNAFTPNGDEINDTFFGKGIGITEFEMMIFDRWGNLIFFSDDINKSWDGKANYGTELAQMDVYVYSIRLLDIKMKKHKYRGKVTLVK